MRVLWLSGLVVILDQATKYVVLQTMYLGQQIALLGDWLKFTYTENPGMAFGITFGPKAMVTVFSIIATVLISMYLVKVRKGYFPYRASLGLILGGAIGNIIDRVFYGVLYGDDAFFLGRVVDFIHVNVWSGFVPDSLPIIGGTYLSLFPIWNVADMAIVCGVVGILVFQKQFHMHEHVLDFVEGAESPESERKGELTIANPAIGGMTNSGEGQGSREGTDQDAHAAGSYANANASSETSNTQPENPYAADIGLEREGSSEALHDPGKKEGDPDVRPKPVEADGSLDGSRNRGGGGRKPMDDEGNAGSMEENADVTGRSQSKLKSLE